MISEDISLIYKTIKSLSQSELVSSIFLCLTMSKHFSTCLLVLIFLLNRCLSIPISISSLLNPASPDDDAPPPSDTRKSPSPQGHNAQHALNPGRSSSSSQGHDAAPELSTQRRAKRKRRSRARAPALESSTQLYDHRGRKSKGGLTSFIVSRCLPIAQFTIANFVVLPLSMTLVIMRRLTSTKTTCGSQFHSLNSLISLFTVSLD